MYVHLGRLSMLQNNIKSERTTLPFLVIFDTHLNKYPGNKKWAQKFNFVSIIYQIVQLNQYGNDPSSRANTAHFRFSMVGD